MLYGHFAAHRLVYRAAEHFHGDQADILALSEGPDFFKVIDIAVYEINRSHHHVNVEVIQNLDEAPRSAVAADADKTGQSLALGFEQSLQYATRPGYHLKIHLIGA